MILSVRVSSRAIALSRPAPCSVSSGCHSWDRMKVAWWALTESSSDVIAPREADGLRSLRAPVRAKQLAEIPRFVCPLAKMQKRMLDVDRMERDPGVLEVPPISTRSQKRPQLKKTSPLAS